MDCPQCGGTLATYALGGEEASVCEDCGYVGIAAEHRGDPRTVESWNDALRRFYRAHGSEESPGIELQPPLSRPAAGSNGESWDDALQRFYARRTSDGEHGTRGEETDDDDTGDTDDDTTDDDTTEDSTGDTDDDTTDDDTTEDSTGDTDDDTADDSVEADPSGS